MNRYVRGSIGAVVGVAKAIVLKIKNGKNFRMKLPTIISSGTEVSVDLGGRFYAERKLSIRRGSRITVRKKGRLTIGKNFYMKKK